MQSASFSSISVALFIVTFLLNISSCAPHERTGTQTLQISDEGQVSDQGPKYSIKAKFIMPESDYQFPKCTVTFISYEVGNEKVTIDANRLLAEGKSFGSNRYAAGWARVRTQELVSVHPELKTA
jgi:hypothetical protein